jgi:hypothetical protein
MTFKDLANLQKGILSNQKPTTLELARIQVEKLKKNSIPFKKKSL